MSKEIVWASNAMINPAMLRLIMYAFEGKDYEESSDVGIPASRENNAGLSLGPACFPPEIYVRKDSNTNYQKLPHLFFAGSYWIVSGGVADVMRQFDLGGGHLYPTKVFRKDRKTPIDDKWYCLNFGNVKKAFIGINLQGVPVFPIPPLDYWDMPTILEDGQIFVTSVALGSPDIWVDPKIANTFFVSDPLASALKAASVATPFGLKKCQIV